MIFNFLAAGLFFIYATHLGFAKDFLTWIFFFSLLCALQGVFTYRFPDWHASGRISGRCALFGAAYVALALANWMTPHVLSVFGDVLYYPGLGAISWVSIAGAVMMFFQSAIWRTREAGLRSRQET
jgi:hypothetical protein